MAASAGEAQSEQQYGPAAHARGRPDAVALIVDGEETTYAEFGDRCRRVADVLRGLGVERGERVAVLVPNSREWFEAVHGAGRVGAIAVPVNVHFKADEVAHVVRDSGAKVVVVDVALVDTLDQVDEVPRLVIGRTDESQGIDYETALAAVSDSVDEDDIVADGWPTTMLYTSGTTGKPKGVAIGEGDFRRTAIGIGMIGMRWNIGADDRYLLVGPSYHAGPAVWAQTMLAVGGSVVVMRRWDTEECLRLLDEYGVTLTHMVPANFIRILDLPDEARGRADLSKVRLVLHAAAPCPIPVKYRIMEFFPPDTVWEYYGASEGGGTSIGPAEWLEHPGSVGKPYPGNEFVVLDDDGNELPRGETGVLWVRTESSSFEYHNDPDKTAATYRDGGWFSVGDMGYMDDEDYVYITDRKSDMVISGGVNIYPREIEDCLYEHPEVVDCAVFGVPDDKWGESLVAVVQRTDGSDLDEAGVIAFVREHLADYKRPRVVEFVAELPRDPNGKVVKRKLRADYLAGGSSASPTDGASRAST
jgi:acyl-CoA synthetase (AMP-forming)/AMP-acid ligase II